MATGTMTPKERWIAALELGPVDRLPFWPKLDASYPHHRSSELAGRTNDDFHGFIGSDRHDGVGQGLQDRRTVTDTEVIRENDTVVMLFTTPQATLRRVNRFDPHSQSWHPVEFPVKEPGDIAVMTAHYADCEPEVDQAAVAEARARYEALGEGSFVCTGIGQSALMHWVEWLAGIENAHYMLYDHSAKVLQLFEEIHRVNLRRAELLAQHNPADAFYMVENTSTTLISVDQYREHNRRHIIEYAEIMRRQGRRVLLHMCGHLKALLPDLAGVPCHGFEAFTRPTLGNTTLLDGRSACPDKCLIGGTQAMDWLRPADEIIAGIEASLDELPHHRGIVVTSAGVMPPWCEPGTIREVCDWVKAYPARV